MKHSFRQLLMLVGLLFCAFTADNETKAENNNETTNMTQKIYLTIDDKTLTATLVDNKSSRALVEALRQAPITYEAHDYGGFEKVGALGQSFPTSDESLTTQPGDLILYQGNNLCIYYGVNSWTFTRLGSIDNTSLAELKQAVKAGQGNVTVTLSLAKPTAIHATTPSAHTSSEYVAINGTRTEHPKKGLYIKNGKKILMD